MADEAPENSQQPAAAPGLPANEAPGAGGVALPPNLEPRILSRKDTSLREFLNQIDDYAPIVGNILIKTHMIMCL